MSLEPLSIAVALCGILSVAMLMLFSHKEMPELKFSHKIVLLILLLMCFVLSYIRYGISSAMAYNAILSSVLCVSSFMDIKTHMVPVGFCSVLILPGVVRLVLEHDTKALLNLGIAIVVFGVLWVLSYLTKNAFGLGDAVLIAIMSYFLGWQTVLALVLCALAGAGAIGLFLITLRKMSRKTEMPFAPFLFVALIIYLIL